MPKKNLVSYSNPSKSFHWLVALLVLLMLSLSFFLGDVSEQYRGQAYMIHKSFGLVILGLMFIRIVWITLRGKPPLPKTVPEWQKKLARIIQYALYLFLLIMPLSGFILSLAADRAPVFFGLFKVSLPITPSKPLAQLMESVHETVAWILIGLITLHILGALKHYFIDRDNVLQTMLPRFKR